MNIDENFRFSNLGGVSSKLVDFSNKILLEKSKIIPINGNETDAELLDLHTKHDVQHMIIEIQYRELESICKKIFQNGEYEYMTLQEGKFLENLDCEDHTIIKRYGDLDLLSKLKKYRETQRTSTPEEKKIEASYIRQLLITTCIQRVIVKHQQKQISNMGKRYISNKSPNVDICDSFGKPSKKENDKDIIIQNGERKLQIINIADLLNNVNTQPAQVAPNSECKLQVINVNELLDIQNKSNKKGSKKQNKTKKKQSKTINNSDNTKQEIKECCICMTDIIQNIALVPCGHTTMCEHCVPELKDKKCPLCREPFTQFIKLFL